jgi:hypothetical protein
MKSHVFSLNGRAVAVSDMSTAAPEDEDDAALPPTAGGVVDRVAAALQAGLWKEKADPRTGRKYYVNTRTKKATWDLAKELTKKGASSSSIAAAVAAMPATSKTEAELRAERQSRARQRIEAESVLANQVAQLEQTKVELEADVARLKVPVEAEAAKLAELRQLVADKRFSNDAVHREALFRRQARDAELRAIMHNVTNLQSVVDSDAAFKESVEAKHRQLLVESMELSADLEKERSASEALHAAAREAELSLGLAHEQLRAQEAEIARKEELVHLAEADLEGVARRRVEAEASIKELEAEKQRLLEKAQKSARISAAATEQQAKAGAASVAQLTEQYQAKVRTLENLAKVEQRDDDALVLEHSNSKLRALIGTAQRDSAALQKLATMLESEIKRVLDVVSIARADTAKVAASLSELERGEAAWQKSLDVGVAL